MFICTKMSKLFILFQKKIKTKRTKMQKSKQP